MRKSAAWMTIWDDRILEYLTDQESASPSVLADVEWVRISRSQLSRRLRTLRDYGLVRHLGNGVYVITEAGEAYLAEELDAEELEADADS